MDEVHDSIMRGLAEVDAHLKGEAVHGLVVHIPDEDIDTSDIPELGDEFFQNARLVMPEDRMKLAQKDKGDSGQ